MWPLDLPACDVLKLPRETAIPWAVFDPDWYLRTYPEAAAATNGDPHAVMEYYLRNGQRLGHSPNLMFDEQWHRLTYPQIADRMADGHCQSAFDAYCRRGALDRSAHWLFDELAYREHYPDLTNDVFAAAQICNGYDHYLRHGAEEGRVGHRLFDPSTYLSHVDLADRAAIRRGGVFQHYLNRTESGEPELRTSLYFDPDWYVQRYPEVAQAIAAKRWKSALHHYLGNDTPTAFDPLESFSEAWYLLHDSGLKTAIEARSFRNGYMHFLRFGARELRSPSASIDLAWYAAQPSVRSDLENQRAPDAYTHWLTIGALAGLPTIEAETEKLTEAHGRMLLHRSAAALLPIAGRFGYCFECLREPAVSVVLVVRDGFTSVMGTIASLRASTASDIELVIVDLGSTDETRLIGRYVPGAKILRFEGDIGWAPAADAGRQIATAPAVLFLSGVAHIAPGSIDRAWARLTANASVGAIGGMMLQSHGLIAQAGGILWNDGGIHHFRHGASPSAPEANFVRDVDFCGPGFLLVRGELLASLSGFDRDCPVGYETVDLCLRIAQLGLRVVYDPSIMVVLCDPIWPDGGCGAHFRRKHQSALEERFAPGGLAQVFARHADPRPQRILFIEDTVPVRRTGSGFVRANDLIQVMASAGYTVTVFPVNGCTQNLATIFHDIPDTVEVMHDLALGQLAAFLRARPLYYDTIWVARIHNLHKVRPILRRLLADGSLKARVVLDTEAVTPYREAMQAALTGQAYDLQTAMQSILVDTDICRHTIAVNAAEARTPGAARVCPAFDHRPYDCAEADPTAFLAAGRDAVRWRISHPGQSEPRQPDLVCGRGAAIDRGGTEVGNQTDHRRLRGARR